jgi:hypothetical protein
VANRCENLLLVSGDDVTPFIKMMEAVEAGTVCYETPFIEHASESKAQFHFDTAWKPCLDWLVEQSRNFPQLSFDLSYHEGNCFVCGSYHVKNGEVLSGRIYEEKNEESLKFLKDVFGWDNYPM